MEMLAFFQMFPDIAERETRTATVTAGLPPGDYTFMDFYCTNPNCDCRRVILWAVDDTDDVLATINHAFDVANADPDLGQTFLDPLNRQSALAPPLRALFLKMLVEDPPYLATLKRHYRLVKDAVRDPAHPIHTRFPAIRRSSTPLTWPAQRTHPSKSNNDPCPCGSGKRLTRCRCGLTSH